MHYFLIFNTNANTKKTNTNTNIIINLYENANTNKALYFIIFVYLHSKISTKAHQKGPASISPILGQIVSNLICGDFGKKNMQPKRKVDLPVHYLELYIFNKMFGNHADCLFERLETS